MELATFYQQTPDSSSINYFEYTYDLLQLKIEFKSGEAYVYFDVDQATVDELTEATSKGRFIATRIKNFRCEKYEKPDFFKTHPHTLLKPKDLEPMAYNAEARWPFVTHLDMNRIYGNF
jgi:KTSC domain